MYYTNKTIAIDNVQDTEKVRLLFSSGNYQECITYCESALNANHSDGQAWKWAGKSCLALGKLEQAQKYLARAYQINQKDPEILKDIGNCLLGRGNQDQAANAYKRALAIQADYPPAIYNLAGIAQISGDHKTAIRLFLKAVELDSSLSQAWVGAAKCALSIGNWDATVDLCAKAISADNSLKGVYQLKGDAHRNKGELDQALEAYHKEHLASPEDPAPLINAANITRSLGRNEDAIRLLGRALELRPEDFLILSNLGCILNDAQHYEEAELCCRRSIMLNPNHAETHANRAISLLELDRIDEAISTASKAVSMDPYNTAFCVNLGSIYVAKGEHEEAVRHMLQALELNPFDPEAHTGLACIQLAKGEYSQGWDSYAYRPQKPSLQNHSIWDGTRQEKILVIGEQGIGDQILYASLVEETQCLCEHLELRVDQRLVPLFKRTFSGNITVDCLDSIGQRSPCDSFIAMADLAKLLRRELADFSHSRQHYLNSGINQSKELAEYLREGSDEKIIGLSWHSAGKGYRNKSKSIELELLATSLRNVKAKLICLQYGDHQTEISSLREKHGIEVKLINGLDLYNDIDGAAALISACDAVVTVSNVTAHLAGALGKETHLLVSRSPNFCWGLRSSRTPWYPSITLYRQTNDGNWSKAIEEIAANLERQD